MVLISGVGIGVGIGIDRKVESLFLQTYMQLLDTDSEPDTDPRSVPAVNVRRNG